MNGPDVVSVESLLYSTITRMLSSFIPEEAAGMVTKMLGPQAKKLFGNDIPWDATLYTNMTPYGVTNYNLRQSIANTEKAVKNSLVETGMNEDMYLVMKSLNSYKSFLTDNSLEDSAQAKEQYEAFLQRKVTGLTNNPAMKLFYPMLSDALGFGDINQASRDLGIAAGNMARIGMRNQNLSAIAAAEEVVGNLFTGEHVGGGVYEKRRFNRADWGGMTRSEVAGVAAALTRDVDFSAGLDLTDAGDADKAVQRLRSTVREYTKAMAPLKDVFGDDVRKMVQTIEGISGQTLSDLGAANVGKMAERISNRVASGTYSLEGQGGLYQMVGAVTSRLQNTAGLTQIGYSSADAQGMLAADMANVGRAKNFTKAQWAALAIEHTVDVANSGAADMASRHYAAWRENNRNLEGASFETFSNQVQQMMAREGVTYDQALQRVSGASGRQLASAYASRYRNDALQTGDAARLAMAGERQVLERRLGNALLVDTALVESRLGGADARKTVDTMFRVLRETPDVFNVESGDKRIEALMKSANISREEATRVDSAMEALRGHSDAGVQKLQGRLMQANSAAIVAKQDAEHARRRNLSAALGESIAQTGSGLMQLFNEKTGFSLEDIKTRLNKTVNVDLAVRDEKDLLSMFAAAGQFVAKTYGADHELAGTYAGNLFNKYASVESLKAKGMQKAFTRYKEAQEKIEAGRAAGAPVDEQLVKETDTMAGVMAAYKETAAKRIDRYLLEDDGKHFNDRARDLSNFLRAQKKGDLEKNQKGQTVDDFLTEQAVEAQLYRLTNNNDWNKTNAGQLWEAFKKQREDVNKDNRVEALENFKEFIERNRTKDNSATIDYLLDITGKAAEGARGPSSASGDVFVQLTSAIQALTDELKKKRGQGDK